VTFVFNVSAPGPDYRLVWPPDLFRAETLALLAQGDGDADRRIRRLFEEAFAEDQLLARPPTIVVLPPLLVAAAVPGRTALRGPPRRRASCEALRRPS